MKSCSNIFHFRRIIRPCLFAVAIVLASCAKPPEKDVPALDPSKAKKETITETPTPEAPSQGTITRMPIGDLYQLTQGNAALIFDVRPKFYYSMGHIPNSISFPEKDFDRHISVHEPSIRLAIRNNTPVVIYCTDLACPDALTVATKLAQRGHNISVLQGGYEAWKLVTP